MGTDPKAPEPDGDATREVWSSSEAETDQPDTVEVVHPRADGDDVDFEVLEMDHRWLSAQR